MEIFRLDGKVAIVTGASSGLGVAIATALAEAGAKVALAARRFDRLEEVRAKITAEGGEAISVQTDVSDAEQCAQLVDTTIKELGQLDILVNNAGIAITQPALRETPETFEQTIATNLAGPFWLSQAAAEVMPPGSSIVNVSSMIAETTAGLPQAVYSASKAGLNGLTRDLAQEWTPRLGIRVNAVLPGFFDTEMTVASRNGYLDTQLHRVLCGGREGDPEELAATVVFLAGRGAGYITGATIFVDGGVSLT